VFGSKRGPLQYGSVRAKYLPRTNVTSRHPWARHVRLDNLSCAGSKPPSALRDLLQRGRGHDDSPVLIYVHGFNTKFDAALARAAQFSMATRFCGPVLAFSWPSAGSWRPTRYFMDGHQALMSNRTFGRVLQGLADAVRLLMWSG
jgi:hypothetical protein